MRNIEECKIFSQILKNICEKYHGIKLWTSSITSKTKPENRNKALTIFQNGSENSLYILNSVRILDEAIDIPKCDSEFIGYVGDTTSDIRTIQRLMRGSRLDIYNRNKINNLFV